MKNMSNNSGNYSLSSRFADVFQQKVVRVLAVNVAIEADRVGFQVDFLVLLHGRWSVAL